MKIKIHSSCEIEDFVETQDISDTSAMMALSTSRDHMCLPFSPVIAYCFA